MTTRISHQNDMSIYMMLVAIGIKPKEKVFPSYQQNLVATSKCQSIFYTPRLEADVISPGFFCRRKKKHYSGFSTGTDFDTNKGFVKFSGRLTSMDIVLTTKISNDLIYCPPAVPVGVAESKINTLNSKATQVLWHHRMNHAHSSNLD